MEKHPNPMNALSKYAKRKIEEARQGGGETEENVNTSVKYDIIDNPESETEVIKSSLKNLRRVEGKMKKGVDLDKQDLMILYAGVLDSKSNPDSKPEQNLIKELLGERKSERRQDLALIFNATEDRISLTEEEALSGDNIVCHYGDLDLRYYTPVKYLKLPKTLITGDLDLRSLETAKGLELPETVNGCLNLEGLTSAEGLKFPKTVNGYLNLYSLTLPKGLNLPEMVAGDLNLRHLKTTQNMKFPDIVDGFLDLSSLESIEDLKLPDIVGHNLYLNKVKAIASLKLPRTVGGDLYFNKLGGLRGIIRFPSHIKGSWHVLAKIDGFNSKNKHLPNEDVTFLTKKYPRKVTRYIEDYEGRVSKI